nr:uncharacterized protein LOC119172189 [Rhipicephalus microplus]
MDENSFLNDTNLSSLHTSEPQATSTVLPEQRIRRSRPACTDIATDLFRKTRDDDSSLGILASNDCLDFSLLGTSARSPAAEQAVMEEAPLMSSSAYLKERFDVSDADIEAQAALGFEESFTDAVAEIIEHDEQQFNREHLLDAYEEHPSCENEQLGEISRPSWMSSGEDDRITISAYLQSRSAPMDPVELFSKAPPLAQETKKESAPAPNKRTIRELVEQQLGMRKSTYREQCGDESWESSLTSVQSESGIDYSLRAHPRAGQRGQPTDRPAPLVSVTRVPPSRTLKFLTRMVSSSAPSIPLLVHEQLNYPLDPLCLLHRTPNPPAWAPRVHRWRHKLPHTCWHLAKKTGHSFRSAAMCHILAAP